MSFSAINYDEMLVPFFLRILALAAITTLAGALVAAGVGRIFRRRPTLDSALARVGSMGLMVAAALGVMTIGGWWHFDLLSPLTLPGPDALVKAFALALSVLSASVTTLVLMAVLRVIERSSHSRETVEGIASS
jgi:hypothetical protein